MKYIKLFEGFSAEKLMKDLEDAEVVASYKTKDGEQVEVKELYGKGMAGEPMTFSYIVYDETLSNREEMKELLSPADFKDLEEYLDGVWDENTSSAESWVN